MFSTITHAIVICPILWLMPPNILTAIIEKIFVFLQNAITVKLSNAPEALYKKLAKPVKSSAEIKIRNIEILNAV